MPELRLEIAGVPPSVGHYNAYRVVQSRGGKAFVQCYHTAKAKDWFATVATVAAGRKLRGSTYTISYAVFTGSAVCSDVDNYAKCIIDSLAEDHGAGVIDNDKKVVDLHGYRRIDRNNPRTVIVVRTDQEQMFGGNQ
jgi:Holliday junction resolvase RusA-like endonuclease